MRQITNASWRHQINNLRCGKLLEITIKGNFPHESHGIALNTFNYYFSNADILIYSLQPTSKNPLDYLRSEGYHK